VVGIATTAFALAAVPASAKRHRAKGPCSTLPINIKLSTHDPTGLLEDGFAWIYVNPRGHIRSAVVKVKRGNRVYAKGRVVGRMARGRTSVIRMHVKRRMPQGRYKVQVTAGKPRCGRRVSKARRWKFHVPSLGLKAIPVSTRVNDNIGVVRFALRPVRRTQVGRVRVSLIGPGGGVVSQRVVDDVDGRQVMVELPIDGKLKPGKYRVRLNGQDQATGAYRQSQQTWSFARGGGRAKPVAVTGQYTQRIAVDWYNGKWKGRQVAGFVAPGIGYGEVVCSPYQQWVRFYPSSGSRESAMMVWAYKAWDHKDSEKSIREAKYTNGTGPDFREGMNKFTPTEKYSTGSFQGIISDRGPIDGPGGSPLAPPTTFDLDWEWNFKNSGKCHVEGTFRTETAEDIDPLARSVQVVWRGEVNAVPANTTSTVTYPKLGNVQVVCEPGQSGTRRLTIDGAIGGKVVTREGSEDYAVSQADGPLIMRLPNNGMLFVTMNNGDRLLVSSRWKVNDPVASRNWCVVAAQIYSPS